MAFSPISVLENQQARLTASDQWANNYKEAFIETQHDLSQLTLILPDDCLVVVGPPRMSMLSSENSSDLYTVGLVNNLSYSETRNVQPLKGLGSRRHIFSATNAPIQGSIQRMMFMAQNLLRVLYANAKFGKDITDRNSTFSPIGGGEGSIYTNLEEDIFRVPFGLGVIYNSPATLAGDQVFAGSDYIECCTLQSKQVSIQAGQTMLMEQVSFFADRTVAWPLHCFNAQDNISHPVTSVSNMG